MERSRYHPRPLCGDSVGPSKCASEDVSGGAYEGASEGAYEGASGNTLNLVVLAISDNIPVDLGTSSLRGL